MTDDGVRDDALSVPVLTTALLRGRVFSIRCGVIIAFLFGLFGILKPREFSSVASFTPQARRQTSSLSGLAAQFGLAVPTNDGSQSPAFYVDLLSSREILGDAVMQKYPVRAAGGRDSVLAQVLGAKGDNDAELRERGILRLRERLAIANNAKTGVVTVTVTTRDPVLSRAVTERLLALLDAFNQERRKSQAASERVFTERRLGEVFADLRAAEDRSQAFLQRNRDYRNSPDLTFQYDRLSRDVSMRQQVYTSLAQAFEQAKIEEVRDTPVVSVVERPIAPPFPDGRGLIKGTLLAFMLGFVLAAVLVLARAMAIPGPQGADELADLEREWVATKGDLRRPVSAFLGRGTARLP